MPGATFPSISVDDRPAGLLPHPSEWSDALVEPRRSPAVERLFRWKTGLAPAVVPYLNPHPWVYRPFLFLMNPALREIDTVLASQICFVVARDNTCRFCYGSFRSMLRIAGYSESQLNRLERDLSLEEKDGRRGRALRLAMAISQGRRDHAGMIDAVHEAGYSYAAIREIIGVTLLATVINRVATMLAIPLNDDLERLTQAGLFRHLQPVLRVLLTGWQGVVGGSRAPLQPDEIGGPFDGWLRQLRGTIVGQEIHHATSEWLTTTSAVPLKTKLLMLAVVARGLGRSDIEERTLDHLSSETGMPVDESSSVLDTLRGPTLSETDERLLQLARASIRYEAGRIQDTARECTRDLSRGETIDAIATLALSNAVARLHALNSLPS